jgi:hypothetical protein
MQKPLRLSWLGQLIIPIYCIYNCYVLAYTPDDGSRANLGTDSVSPL